MKAPKHQTVKQRWSIQLPASSADGVPPSEFRIFAAGVNESELGPAVFDDISSASVMRLYQMYGKATLFDFNHGTECPYPTPDQAVAAGEFTPEIRGGELWATNIKWTDRAQEFLRAKEYRYFSPTFEMDPDSRRVMRIISCALTNRPALNDIAPLVAASANQKDEESPMNEAEIKALQARVTELETENKTLRAGTSHVVALSAALQMNGATPAVEQLSVVQGLVSFQREILAYTGQDSAPKAMGVVSAWRAKSETADRLVAENATREEQRLTEKMNAVLDGAIKDGKLSPALREHEAAAVLAFGGGKPSDKGLEWAVAKFSATLPIVATPGGATPQPAGGLQLSPERIAIARQMGRDPAEIAKFEAARLSGQTA